MLIKLLFSCNYLEVAKMRIKRVHRMNGGEEYKNENKFEEKLKNYMQCTHA